MKKVINGIFVNKKYFSIRKDGNKLSDRKANRLIDNHVKTLSGREIINDFYGLLVTDFGKRDKRKIVELSDVRNFIVKG